MILINKPKIGKKDENDLLKFCVNILTNVSLDSELVVGAFLQEENFLEQLFEVLGVFLSLSLNRVFCIFFFSVLHGFANF